jgi:hypothetical protein
MTLQDLIDFLIICPRRDNGKVQDSFFSSSLSDIQLSEITSV